MATAYESKRVEFACEVLFATACPLKQNTAGAPEAAGRHQADQ